MKHKPRVIEIPAGHLTFDDRYQREIVASRIRKMADAMDLDSLGIITVSKRSDETFVVVDGQHRVKAVLHHGFGEWKMKCNVYEGLTLAEEARLFRTLNDSRRITAFDDFRAGLVQGDQECQAMLKICKKVGLEISNQSADGKVACVTALRKVYRNNNGRPGGEILADTLDTAVAAWGAQASSVDGKIVEGLAIVVGTYGEEVDRPALIKKLAKVGGGAPGIIGMARGLQEHRGCSVPRCIAAIAVDLYNKGRRKGALTPL